MLVISFRPAAPDIVFPKFDPLFPAGLREHLQCLFGMANFDNRIFLSAEWAIGNLGRCTFSICDRPFRPPENAVGCRRKLRIFAQFLTFLAGVAIDGRKWHFSRYLTNHLLQSA